MLTPRQRLARIARIGLAIQVIAILPAVVAMMGSWNPSNQDSAFVQWCASYWWSLLLLAAFVYTAVAYALSFLLRCPHCRYRLSRAYTPTWAIASHNAHIRYCAHCGLALDASRSD